MTKIPNRNSSTNSGTYKKSGVSASKGTDGRVKKLKGTVKGGLRGGKKI